jgi:nitroreductase
MELTEAIKTRRSIRKYQDKEISNELIEKIIDNAHWAPSGMNIQPWQFVVIKDKEKLKTISKMYADARDRMGIYKQDTSFIEYINLILVLSSKEQPWAINNCHYAIQNILLSAKSESLGSLCLGALMQPEDVTKLKQMCKVPENLELIMPVVIGYPDEQPEPTKRKSVSNILHYDSF